MKKIVSNKTIGTLFAASCALYGFAYGANVKQTNAAQLLVNFVPYKTSIKPKFIIGSTLTTLVNFDGINGQLPEAGLVQDSLGNFYGTTLSGGTSGRGTVFKLKPDGTLKTLVSFNNFDGNGYNPSASLLLGANGSLYGTTLNGGGTIGFTGTIFRVSPNGALKTLFAFPNGGSGGTQPSSRLFQDSNGNLYGTNINGGTGNRGTVFKLAPNRTLKTLVTFNLTNGDAPEAGLIQGSNGSLYGTTLGGGTSNIGTVFKVSRSGTGFKTLVNFGGSSSSGRYPQSELLLASDGNFYGTTSQGGTVSNGTVFKMNPKGTITTLVSFTGTGGTSPGRLPMASLIQGNDGNFYGTTKAGGTFDKGTVFQLLPNGTLSTLVNFDGTNGSDPRAELIQAADGNFYGTTSQGGINNKGTIFKLALN